MHPAMYSNYQVGVGQPSPFVVVDGVKRLTPAGNTQMAGFLSALFFGGSPIIQPGESADAPIVSNVATTCDNAKAAGGDCSVTALATLKTTPAGTTVIVDAGTASSSSVMVTFVTKVGEIRALAGGGSPGTMAVFDPNATAADKKDEGAEPAAIALGAVAGGALGFAAGGPVGALAGAVGGGLVANWLA